MTYLTKRMLYLRNGKPVATKFVIIWQSFHHSTTTTSTTLMKICVKRDYLKKLNGRMSRRNIKKPKIQKWISPETFHSLSLTLLEINVFFHFQNILFGFPSTFFTREPTGSSNDILYREGFSACYLMPVQKIMYMRRDPDKKILFIRKKSIQLNLTNRNRIFQNMYLQKKTASLMRHDKVWA